LGGQDSLDFCRGRLRRIQDGLQLGNFVTFIKQRWNDYRGLKLRRSVITLFVVIFSIAAIVLLYKGVTSGNYLLVALVFVVYVFVLMLEASLRLGSKQQQAKKAPKRSADPHTRALGTHL